MKRNYAELQCDKCGQAEHFPTSTWRATALEYGWIITRSGKHFCTAGCRNLYTETPGKQQGG